MCFIYFLARFLFVHHPHIFTGFFHTPVFYGEKCGLEHYISKADSENRKSNLRFYQLLAYIPEPSLLVIFYPWKYLLYL